MTAIPYVIDVLSLFSKADCHTELMWHADGQGGINFSVLCSDLFSWGTADCEEIAPDTLEELRQAFSDAPVDGPALYCARRRKMRPQGAAYKYISTEAVPLFDACGPLRVLNLLNPKPQSKREAAK